MGNRSGCVGGCGRRPRFERKMPPLSTSNPWGVRERMLFQVVKCVRPCPLSPPPMPHGSLRAPHMSITFSFLRSSFFSFSPHKRREISLCLSFSLPFLPLPPSSRRCVNVPITHKKAKDEDELLLFYVSSASPPLPPTVFG